MSNINVVDSIFIDPEQRDGIRRLFALGYSAREIAMTLDLDNDDRTLFVYDSITPGTTINYLQNQALLITRTAPAVKLHEAAEAGNIDAFKELVGVQRNNEFNKILNEMDDDEYNC